MRGTTLFITGPSRGIGLAMAYRALTSLTHAPAAVAWICDVGVGAGGRLSVVGLDEDAVQGEEMEVGVEPDPYSPVKISTRSAPLLPPVPARGGRDR